MELKIKKGEVYHVELPMDIVPGLKKLPKEDYESYLLWTFKNNELPGCALVDVDSFFGFEIGSKLYFVDGWTVKSDEEPKDVIQRYFKEALEVLTKKGILENAIKEHRKELEE